MKILIVDDEKLACQRLELLINELKIAEVVGFAHNGKQALKETVKHQPDIILLDIRMPGMDGIETAQHINSMETPPTVIFTTAYDDYALKAFETHAIDYLLKPIRKERLQDAINSAKNISRLQLNELRRQSENASREHISVRIQGDIRLIPIRDINYLLADQKYITVGYILKNEIIEVLIDESLVSLEKEFPSTFFRIHRNALIAKKCFEALEKNSQGQMKVKCKNSEKRFDVSRRHLSELRKFLK
ncbi:Autolysis response regulater LytR [hydrothermal vent metagenome]|uniref:Autolysis response regulater LytR n=1 Tax=hydrothermal vent metagenome TaxID=652676 RepID=A0A3B0ZMF0_9ZZZZ